MRSAGEQVVIFGFKMVDLCKVFFPISIRMEPLKMYATFGMLLCIQQ